MTKDERQRLRAVEANVHRLDRAVLLLRGALVTTLEFFEADGRVFAMERDGRAVVEQIREALKVRP